MHVFSGEHGNPPKMKQLTKQKYVNVICVYSSCRTAENHKKKLKSKWERAKEIRIDLIAWWAFSIRMNVAKRNPAMQLLFWIPAYITPACWCCCYFLEVRNKQMNTWMWLTEPMQTKQNGNAKRPNRNETKYDGMEMCLDLRAVSSKRMLYKINIHTSPDNVRWMMGTKTRRSPNNEAARLIA